MLLVKSVPLRQRPEYVAEVVHVQDPGAANALPAYSPAKEISTNTARYAKRFMSSSFQGRGGDTDPVSPLLCGDTNTFCQAKAR